MEGPYSARFPSSSVGEKSRRAPARRGAADQRSPRARAVPLRTEGRVKDGQPMSTSFRHEPVMRDDVVALIGAVPPGVVVDATVGGGGHAAAILENHPHLRLLGL